MSDTGSGLLVEATKLGQRAKSRIGPTWVCLTHPGLRGEEEGEAEQEGNYKGLSELGFFSPQCFPADLVILWM